MKMKKIQGTKRNDLLASTTNAALPTLLKDSDFAMEVL
jgi:hypothetical protein